MNIEGAETAWQTLKDWVEKVAHFHVAQHQNDHRLAAMPDHIFAKVKAELQIAESKVRALLDLPSGATDTDTSAPAALFSDQPADAGTSSQESAAPTVPPVEPAPLESPAPTTPTSPAP